jgi:GNAT superfamily N-acetyltransferase
MPAWSIERLGKHHERDAFDCGKQLLDAWLKQFAGQHEKKDLARVYVLVRPGQPRVYGYYAISNCQIAYESLPAQRAKGLPGRQIIPGALLGRLAVDRSVRGQGLGDALLFDALKRIAALSEEIGIQALVVHALDDDAAAYYRHKGFEPFANTPRHLFLPMTIVRKLAGG